MAHSLQQDPLLSAFGAIANADETIPPHYLSALNVAVRRFTGRMWLAGRPIEHVVAHIKSMATEAGVRESQDRIVQDAVLWAITFYGETMLDPIPSSVRYGHRSSERTVPIEVAVESLPWVTEEFDVRGPQSPRDAMNSPDNRKQGWPAPDNAPETMT